MRDATMKRKKRKKLRQKKDSVVDEILYAAILAGAKRNQTPDEDRPRRVFRLRVVPPWRRVWRNVKAFLQRLFLGESSL